MKVFMDATDIGILRIMGLRPYGQVPKDMNSFKASFIAKKIGVEPKTAKARIRQMEKAGFIRFYQIYPNFAHLNMSGSGYLFNVKDEDRKQEIIKRIGMVDELFEIHDFMGKELCVDLGFHTNHDLDKKIGLLREFTGDPKPICFYHRHMPTVNRKLSITDWRIIKALRHNALEPLGKISKKLNITLKTAKRRADRMAGEGSFFIVPALDPSKARGLMLFELLVYTNPKADSKTIRQILEATKDNYVYHYIPASTKLGNFDMILFTDSTGKIQELKQKIDRIQGVSRTRALILQGWFDYTDWIDSTIDHQISALVQNREN
ncbi:MAG TPA: hypothetical protein VJG83_00065 [archaeon]|nr:hypothetical protein [archaeon]